MASVVQKEFGRRVRGLRQAAGLSQEELAFRAKLTRTYLSQIETGSRDPSLSTLARLARGLAVSLPELVKVSLPPRGLL